MAERRMFAKSIVLSDAFLDMPMSARCLYFTLGMFADDDGFVGSPKAIMRQCGASQDDMAVLIQKRYVLLFESGVIVIKHWRMNNYLQNDRHKDTTYLEELSTLAIDERGAYTEASNINGSGEMYTKCIQTVYTGKDSIGKDSIGKDIYVEIIQYLNEKTHKSYRWQTKSTQRMINGRIEDGFTVDDFKTVIDKKCAEWLGDKEMDQYLRPETLFAAKHFESYLNQKMPGQKQDVMAMAAGLEKEMEAKYGRKDT